MAYQRLKGPEFFKVVDSEEKARQWVWQTKFGKDSFKCRACGVSKFYQHRSKPEIRTCSQCLKQTRLRAGTIFEHSKLPGIKATTTNYSGSLSWTEQLLAGEGLEIKKQSLWL